MKPRTRRSKVLTREELLDRFGRGHVGTVVFTNGCFDLLHPGHVHCLERARALGDALVVGVNTDASVARLNKGPGRPFVAESDRAAMVASLEPVDAVVLFGEDSPAELVRALRPDVLVKGADYALEDVVGRDVVEEAGGRVELIPLMEGYSTTELLERIRKEDL